MNRRLAADAENAVADDAGIRRRRRRLDQHALTLEIYEAGTLERERSGCRFHDVRDRKSIGRQLPGIGFDVDFPRRASEHVDFGNTGKRDQPWLDHIVRDVAQRIGIERFGSKADLEQRARARRQGRQLRCRRSRWKLSGLRGQSCENVLSRIEEVCGIREIHGDDRQLGNGLRPQRDNALGASDRLLERVGNKLFDLLRSKSGSVRMNGYARRHEFRKDVKRAIPGSPCRQHERDDAEQRDGTATSYGKRDEPFHRGSVFAGGSGAELVRKKETRAVYDNRLARRDPLRNEIAAIELEMGVDGHTPIKPGADFDVTPGAVVVEDDGVLGNTHARDLRAHGNEDDHVFAERKVAVIDEREEIVARNGRIGWRAPDKPGCPTLASRLGVDPLHREHRHWRRKRDTGGKVASMSVESPEATLLSRASLRGGPRQGAF